MRPMSHPRRRPRLGLALRRHPAARWALLTVATGTAAVLVMSAYAGADAARAEWGAARVVAVATRDLPAGHRIRADDVELVARPEAVVPAAPVLEDPAGRVVHGAVFEGEVLVEDRLARPGQRGVAARVPTGHRAVAIPREPGTTPALEAGQHVDLIVVLPPVEGDGGDEPPGLVVAAGALVVDVAVEAITVAVDEDAATRVAVALAHGAVTIALTGG